MKLKRFGWLLRNLMMLVVLMGARAADAATSSGSVGAAGVPSAPLRELNGVAEHLGARSLAMDVDWLWALLLLIAVVATLFVFHRRDRRK